MDCGHYATGLAVAHQWTHKVNTSDDGHPERRNVDHQPGRRQPPASRAQREGVAGMANQTAHGTLLVVGACLRQAGSGKIKNMLLGDPMAALKLLPQRTSASRVSLRTRRGLKATKKARHDE